MPAARGFVIALLGAESTGKTTLAQALQAALAGVGTGTETSGVPAGGARRVALVSEYLREFCDRERRTPHRHEQPPIADEQTRRIAAAAASHDIVIADTTALMTAVYSDLVFGDTSLYPRAQGAHAQCDLTLLAALDLPWQADGLQRDGAHVREPVDALVRAALGRAGTAYSVVFGSGTARLEAALACVRRALAPDADSNGGDGGSARWHWHCEHCGDPQCEALERHRLLPGR
ncbi:MAG: AAA family ATPase [Burkholderiales bacterium]|nr:AAA family ATPase [Burkholderiales bacterium]